MLELIFESEILNLNEWCQTNFKVNQTVIDIIFSTAIVKINLIIKSRIDRILPYYVKTKMKMRNKVKWIGIGSRTLDSLTLEAKQGNIKNRPTYWVHLHWRVNLCLFPAITVCLIKLLAHSDLITSAFAFKEFLSNIWLIIFNL